MKVSVIIPTYNGQEYIKETIESVLSQTYKDFETIVVDDGSTDKTKEIVQLFSSKVQYIYQENKGAAAARNSGLLNSHGEYLVFLDHDDVLIPEKLEKQIRILEDKKELAFVFSDMYMINENGVITSRHNKGNDGPLSFERLFNGNFIITPGVALFRRKSIEELGGFDPLLIVASDYDIFLRLVKEYSFEYMEEPLLKYRMHDNNSSHDLLKYKVADEMRVFNKPEVVSSVNFLKRRIRIAKAYHENAEEHFIRDEFVKARDSYLKALLTFPLIGFYVWPEEAKRIRFSFFYRILIVYFKALECFLRRA